MKAKIAVGVAAVLALAGCTDPAPAPAYPEYGTVTEQTVTISDGRVITCLFWYVIGTGPAMSCDWESNYQLPTLPEETTNE